MKGWQQEVQRVLGIRHLQTQAHEGETWLTDLDTASGDCLSCSDTDDMSIWTTWKRYRKRVRVSCKLIKGSNWTEAQMKRIRRQSSGSHMGPWPGHHQVRAEMHSSWRLRLLWDVEDDSQDLTSCSASSRPLAQKSTSGGPEAETDGRAKKLVQSLKQYHAQFYYFYEKGSTRAMIGLQGLHSNDMFWCSTVAASMGLKSFCPWCFKLGGNTETITTHLREVHYRLAIACDVCWSFASMSVQVVLEHWLGCRMKLHKKPKVKKQDEAS